MVNKTPQAPKVIAHIRHDRHGHPYAAMHSAYDEQGDGLKEGAELVLASSALASLRAAQEGDLPPLPEPQTLITESDVGYRAYTDYQMREYARLALAAQSAGEVERGDVVAFEFYNRATGHAIVDYSVNTHVGKLSADKGYEARPLVYADKREEVTDGSKPIPLWQAREALDELEAAARGDAPFNHQAAAVVRAALSQKEPQR